MATAGVELKNVTKIFEDKQGRSVVAVDDVSFIVEKGELLTLLGPSGCGKTTILRMIGGFETSTKGDIIINGQSVGLLPPNLRNTSMVFQSYALFPHMTLFSNIAYGPRLKKRGSREEIKQKVLDIMKVAGLEGMEDRMPSQLSGGQQQRVALARALINEPSVLLFDEPLSNLDAKLRVQMREEIRRIQRKLGITSVYVTHDQEEAVCISDRIIVMHEGIVEQIGTPREIYERPASRFVASFFGKVNFLQANVKQIDGDLIRVILLEKEFQLSQPGHTITPDKRVEAVLRPEAITISDKGDGIPGVIKRAVYMGNVIEYLVESGGQEVLIAAPNPKVIGMLPEGENIHIHLDAYALHILEK